MTEGPKFDRLLKGRFYQVAADVGNISESFSEQYDRTRMMERHDKQYLATAAAYGDSKKSQQGNNTKTARPSVDLKGCVSTK